MSAGYDPPDHGSDWDGLSSVVDREALDDLFSVTYDELRRLASSVRRRRLRNASLSPTTLVNEAWVKLAGSPAFRSTSPSALQAHRGACDAAGPDRGRPTTPRRQTRRR